MPWKFNPFSGTLDQAGSGGGGSSYIDGEVQNFSALPETLGTPAVDSAYLVREAEGTWLLARKPAGIYIRTANTGTRASDWTYAGEFPDVFSDANFVLYDNGDSTKNLQFQLSGIDTATTRTLTAPNASGTIARTEDFAAPPAIGNTTPNSGAFTTLSANNGTLTASAPVLDLSQTWNDSGVRFDALKMDITRTAAEGRSAYMQFYLAGAEDIQLAPDFIGRRQAVGNGQIFSGFSFNGQGVGRISISARGANVGYWGETFLWIAHAMGFGWSPVGTSPSSTNVGTGLFQDANNNLAQRNGTNPQTFRLYNTFTDASNYERGFMRWSSNVLQIGTEKGGTGSARALELQTNGVTRLSLSTNDITRFHGDVPAIRGNSSGNIYVLTGNVNEGLSGASSYIGGGNGGSSLFRIGTSNAVSLEISGGTSPLVRFGGTTSSFPALKRSSTTLQVRLADDSAFAPLECAGLTLNGNLTASTRNIVTDTTTGTKIGTATTQKIGFFDKTPVVQPTAVADATDAATVITQLNALLSRMRDLGLIAT